VPRTCQSTGLYDGRHLWGGLHKASQHLDEVASRWDKNAESYQRSELSVSKFQQENSNHVLLSNTNLEAEASKKSVASIWQQLCHFAVRSLQQLSQDILCFFTDLGLVLVPRSYTLSSPNVTFTYDLRNPLETTVVTGYKEMVNSIPHLLKT